jgi:hypothetical protein
VTRAATLAGYATIAVAMVCFELVQRRRVGTTARDAVTWALQVRGAKWLVLAAWLWLGWHLFVRVDRG